MVDDAVVEKRLVVVAFVPIALAKTRLPILALSMVEEPIVPSPKLKLVEKRLVELAVSEKRLVVVAFVARSELIVPRSAVRAEEKRLVVVALAARIEFIVPKSVAKLVEKKLVVVAEVPVALSKVNPLPQRLANSPVELAIVAFSMIELNNSPWWVRL